MEQKIEIWLIRHGKTPENGSTVISGGWIPPSEVLEKRSLSALRKPFPKYG